MDLHQGLGPLHHVGRADLGVKVVDLEGGHEKGAHPGHHVEQVRFLCQIAAVLDGAGAALDGPAQPRPAHGVAHGLPAQGAGLPNQCLDLVGAEGGVLGAVAAAGAGPAGGGELYDVGANPDQLAHLGPHAVDPVGHAGGKQRVVFPGPPVPGGTYVVAQAAGGGDDAHRDHQAGAGAEPLLDRLLEAGVQPSGVSDAGVSGGQGLLQHLGGAQVLQGDRLGKAPAAGQVVALGGQVVVAIDEAGQQGQSGNVDDLGGGWKRDGGRRSHGLDPLAVNEDGRVPQHRPPGAVDEVGADESFHGAPPAAMMDNSCPGPRGRCPGKTAPGPILTLGCDANQGWLPCQEKCTPAPVAPLATSPAPPPAGAAGHRGGPFPLKSPFSGLATGLAALSIINSWQPWPCRGGGVQVLSARRRGEGTRGVE